MLVSPLAMLAMPPLPFCARRYRGSDFRGARKTNINLSLDRLSNYLDKLERLAKISKTTPALLHL
jgi:hypothetical protein